MCRRPSTRLVIATCMLLVFSSSIIYTFADELQQVNNQIRRHGYNKGDSRDDGSRIANVDRKVSSNDETHRIDHTEENDANEYYNRDRLLRISKESTTFEISRKLKKTEYKRRRPHRRSPISTKMSGSSKANKPSQAPSTSSQPSMVPSVSYVPTVQSSTVPSTSTEPSSQPSSQPSDVPSTSVSPTVDPLRSTSSSKSSKKRR